MTDWRADLLELLHAPERVIERCHADSDVRGLAAVALASVALGGACFGAAVGAERGVVQALSSAAKIPLATLATLVVCAPAFYAVAAVFGRRWPASTLVALVLAAAARASCVLFALAPVLWLVSTGSAGYHTVKLCAALAYGTAGAAALAFVVRALGRGAGRVPALGAFVVVFAVAGTQAAWLLRPYIGDPADERVPFIASGAEGGGAPAAIYRSTREALVPEALR